MGTPPIYGRPLGSALGHIHLHPINQQGPAVATGAPPVQATSDRHPRSRHPWRALLGGFYALPVIDAEAERQNEIELTNRAVIEVGTATLDGLRGHTVAAAILDELAFWQVDGGNPAEEVIASVRPALATLRGKGP